jgi:aminotransferase/cystathionine beta-lyase
MKYDFETVVSRADGSSSKWELMKKQNPNVPPGIVPLSVADMEFKTPPEIVEALKKYLDETVLGYPMAGQSFFDAVSGWMKRRHGWEVKPEWLVNTQGVVTAFFFAVQAFSEPGDGIIVMPPVYYPFYMAAERNGRTIVRNPLVYKDGRYSIDYEDLEKKAGDPRNKVLLFSSPHNPVGRVWTKEELLEVGRICNRNNVVMLSDEIHHDLIMPGFKHTVYATLGDEYADNCVIFTAPSKTFNLAGLQASNIFIPNKDLFDRYLAAAQRVCTVPRLNILSYKACETAYNECEEWLEQLLRVIDKNRRALASFIEANVPPVKMSEMEGTYLQWMDFNPLNDSLGIDYMELERIMQQEAFLFLDEGYIFGEEGQGFERINLACPTSVLEAANQRLLDALKPRLKA